MQLRFGVLWLYCIVTLTNTTAIAAATMLLSVNLTTISQKCNEERERGRESKKKNLGM